MAEAPYSLANMAWRIPIGPIPNINTESPFTKDILFHPRMQQARGSIIDPSSKLIESGSSNIL